MKVLEEQTQKAENRPKKLWCTQLQCKQKHNLYGRSLFYDDWITGADILLVRNVVVGGQH